MVKLKLLRVEFDTTIQPNEVFAFRGAVIAKVGQEDSLLFHNHLDDQKYNYRYPLIQYKRIGSRPTMLCLHEGVDEIHKFFEQKDWSLHFHDRTLEMKIAKLDMKQFTMQVWDRDFTYEIQRWIALDQESYKAYQEIEGIGEQVRFLETKLVGNILSFAKGIGWTLPPKDEKPLVCKILQMLPPRTSRVKSVVVMSFDLRFKTNVFLPNYIGLGKNVSMGYGVVKEVRNEKEESTEL